MSLGVGDQRAEWVAQAPQQTQNLSSLPPIERLNGRENWPTWKFAVETYLELEELLWETVKPIPNADGTQPAVDERKCRRARAKTILLLDPINTYVKDAKTAREVWAKLEAAFEDTGLTRRVALLRKLITISLSSCGSVDTYVTEIVSTAHNLRGVGFEISEEWIGSLLLAGLPEYKPMIMALENSGTPITGDSIKTKLLQEVQFSSDKTAFVGRKSSPCAVS